MSAMACFRQLSQYATYCRPLRPALGSIEIPFLAANLVKLLHGAWIPISIATVLFALMVTWKKGREEITRVFTRGMLPLDLFLQDLATSGQKIQRVPGTAVFLSSSTSIVPNVLLHHIKHNKVLHDKIILLTIQILRVPEIHKDEKTQINSLGQGFFQIIARYGYMETPNIPRALKLCEETGFRIDINSISYYLGHETLILSGHTKMFRWQKHLFSFLSRNARSASLYFHLPPNRVIELGLQVEI